MSRELLMKKNKTELVDIINKHELMENTLLAKIEKIEADLKEKTNYFERLVAVERRMAIQEQYSRRECVEITSLPVVNNDKELEETVVDLFNEAGVPVVKRDFHAIHRLGDNKTVIAKLVNRRDAISILRKKRTVREFDEDKKKKFGAKGRIYVNESLCRPFKKLFGICNSLFKLKKLESFYSFNGNIKIKMFEGVAAGGTTSISHLSDLYNLFGHELIEEINMKHLESRKHNSQR